MALEEAVDAIRRLVKPVGRRAVKSPREAVNHVTCTDVRAPNDLPPLDTAAFDGYAVRSEDTPGLLRLSGMATLGRPLENGETVLIGTGEPLPAGADAVVPLEAARPVSADLVEVPRAPRWWNVDRRGSFVKEGEVLVGGCSLVSPLKAAGLAAMNVRAIEVYERPRVLGLTFYRGDDVSLWLLLRLVERFAPWVTMETPRELPLPEGFSPTLLEPYNAAVFVGGAGPGASDALDNLVRATGAEIAFRGVNIRGGRPTSLLFLGSRPILWLPGPPVTLVSTFFLLGLPFLCSLVGCESVEGITRLRGRLLEDYTYDRPTGLFATLADRGPELGVQPVDHKKQRILNASLLLRAEALAIVRGKTARGEATELFLLP